MNRRNWLDLARKLVDVYDMDFTLAAIQEALGEASLSYFGEGVISTTIYPNPFPVTMSGLVLGGTVGNGIAYDPNGQLTRIDTSSPTPKTFTIAPADTVHPRWDLLVLRYKMTGDTLVPKPSDPITTIDLNLHDDFELATVTGVASVSPAYPAKGVNDIILEGLRIPANASIGTGVTVDDTIREVGNQALVQLPVFKKEIPTGAVNNSNKVFHISQVPASTQSLLVMVDNAVLYTPSEWTIAGQDITLQDAPALGQSVYVFYIENSPHSQNQLAGLQEFPAGAVDGINDTFTLVGKPPNQAATIVVVDGAIIPDTEWDLVESAPNYKVKFHAGSIPAPGQPPYAFYFVNASAIGMGGGGGGGGGGGALAVFGSTGVPIIVTAAGGVAVSSDQRQLRMVASTGGAVPVTATPQIGAGSMVGQELVLSGESDSNYISLSDGNGLSLNGPINLTRNGNLYLFWNGSVWREISARRP